MISRRQTNRSKLLSGNHGMTLIEVIVLLAAIVLLAGALAPSLVRQLHMARANEVLSEMQALHAAIAGPEKSQTHGFVGDIGRLPANLSELVSGGSLPLFAVSQSTGVGRGWNGPYVNIGVDAEDYGRDAWGRAYDLNVVGPGQIRSAGPNGFFNDDDDIVYPPQPVDAYGSIVVLVKGFSGELVINNPIGCIVSLGYSNNGIAAVAVDDTTPFSFDAVHRGLHTIDATCPRLDETGLAMVAAVVAVNGHGAQQLVELHVDLGVVAVLSAKFIDADAAGGVE